MVFRPSHTLYSSLSGGCLIYMVVLGCCVLNKTINYSLSASNSERNWLQCVAACGKSVMSVVVECFLEIMSNDYLIYGYEYLLSE